MSSTITTIFGQFESPVEGIRTSEFGGPGHSCRRTFALVSKEGLVGGVDIQGRDVKTLKSTVVDFLGQHGFKPVEAAIA